MLDVDLTPDAYFSIDITKVEEKPDGTVMVYGCPANPETLDNDGQIADEKWLRDALPEWFHTGGNIREMHQPIAAGTATKLDWKNQTPQIAAKVVDPESVRKVRHRVLRAFSIGVKKPETRYDREAPGGRIVGGKIVEVSLVDRPSIPGSDIESFKAAVETGLLLCKAVGANEWLDAQRGVVLEEATLDRTEPTGGEMTEKAAAADSEKRDFDRSVGGGVDRDKIPAEDFAGKNRSYPIVKPGDVSDAASSIGQAGDDNYSPEQLKENIIRIARRKGPAFVAEIPEAWKGEDKAASVDTGKAGSGAYPDSQEEASPEMDDETKAAAGGDTGKSAVLDRVEKQAAESAFCPNCGTVEKISGGEVEKVNGVSMIVGKDAAGHTLRKVIQEPEAAKSADGGEDAADGDSDEEKAAAAEAEAEKAEQVGGQDSDGDGDAMGDTDGDGDGEKSRTADAAKTLDAAVAKSDEIVKAAILSLFKDAGIDLGKVGRRMAKARLDRFTAACNELAELAKELAGDEDAEKAASAGGPTLADGTTGLNITRFVDALKVVNELARELRAGDGTFGRDVEGEDGHDMGTAQDIRIRDRIDTNEKHAAADLTKADVIAEATKMLGPELAKSVAHEISRVFDPLVERLEKVEHTAVPARPPILIEADRRHALDGDLQKHARTEEALKADLEKSLAGMTDQKREEILASLVASARGWR